MYELLVPYGKRSDGELVRVADADKSSTYFCPGCDDRLILRDGEKRLKNFAHSSNQCSAESLWHRTAKALLRMVIERNASGESDMIKLQCTCKSCGEVNAVSIKSKHFDGATEEHRQGEFVCDVVAFGEGRERLALEVVYTNPMSELKKQNLSIPWIELSALDVIENPYTWRPISAKLLDWTCRVCRTPAPTVQDVADRFGIERSLYSIDKSDLSAKYVAAVENCYGCKQDIPVFWWRGVPFCEELPPEPRPKTIRYRYSKMYGGKYWANVCAGCGAPQGDNFLFLNGGVLADMPKTKLPADVRPKKSVAMAQFERIIARNVGS